MLEIKKLNFSLLNLQHSIRNGFVDKDVFYNRDIQRLLNITFANNHSMFACINCVSMCPYVANSNNR